MRHWLLATLIAAAPTVSLATTAADLSGRIHVNGSVADFEADEWILDDTSPRPEQPDDSRWGSANDIHRIAITWDEKRFYVAVDGSAYDAGYSLWIQYGAGGIARLESAGDFYRAINLSGIRPNVFVFGNDVSSIGAARVDAQYPFSGLNSSVIPRAMSQDATGRGAMEMSMSWADIGGVPQTLRILAATTGGTASGAGDGAPDPSSPLPYPRDARGTLDNVLIVTVDGDGDGQADLGVSPRDSTTVSPGTAPEARSGIDVGVALSLRSFAPDMGETVEWTLTAGEPTRVFVTSGVYDMGGRRVRAIAVGEDLIAGAASPPQQSWDGRDDSGEVVPGGVYIVNVTWGFSNGQTDGATRTTVVVVR